MTTTPPVDLQAIEARCEAAYRSPDDGGFSTFILHIDEAIADVKALLSLLREKDQVIERLNERADIAENSAKVFYKDRAAVIAQLATLKAGQEARELDLLQFAAFGFGVNCDEARAALFVENFNATHSGEKMK